MFKKQIYIKQNKLINKKRNCHHDNPFSHLSVKIVIPIVAKFIPALRSYKPS